MMPKCKYRALDYYGHKICCYPFARSDDRREMPRCEVLGDIREYCPMPRLRREAVEIMDQTTIFGEVGSDHAAQ